MVGSDEKEDTADILRMTLDLMRLWLQHSSQYREVWESTFGEEHLFFPKECVGNEGDATVWH